MSFFTGTEVGLAGLQGPRADRRRGVHRPHRRFANTREVTPLIAGVALAAQVGAGFTAELGAMRINEEIDALEVMSVPAGALPRVHPDHGRPDRRSSRST